MSADKYSDMSLFDMFRQEVRNQSQVIVDGLLALERNPDTPRDTEACMRAAHSLKGAARIVGLASGVRMTHAMEDCFVAAQRGQLRLRQEHIDVLLRGVDLLSHVADVAEVDVARWEAERERDIAAFLAALDDAIHDRAPQAPAPAAPPSGSPADPAPLPPAETPAQTASAASQARGEQRGDAASRVVRISSGSLTRLLALAGETLVESRWLKPFANSLLRVQRMHYESLKAFEDLRDLLSQQGLSEQMQIALAESHRRLLECQQALAQRAGEVETYDRRSVDLARRLYDEALASRMGPFSEATQAFPRMVRDVARTLGKNVRLKIGGEATLVDRDMMERLDAPLGHLLRNAVDHGIEPPAERAAAGKPPEGLVQLEARHSAGLLHISVSDDGRGIDLDWLRAAIVERKLSTAETVARMGDAELLEFLFLPGFSLKREVTDISGRGVGLDVVQDSVKQVRGMVRVTSAPGRGTTFQLQLPLSLSVLRTLVVRINGELYALPLSRIYRALKLERKHIELLEGQQHFRLGEQQIGLATAHQVLGVDEPGIAGDLSVAVVGEGSRLYGLIVDEFVGERELVVQPLDPRLGKVPNLSAGALLDDGSPVLIVDLSDMLLAVEKLVSGGGLSQVRASSAAGPEQRGKRVLVVDDSLTVRELERKLLGSHGYEVHVAVDGMDGWNAVRTSEFDLVVTDIDMPRMDGIELVTLIKKNPHLKEIPVMVVSYKDREEDRQRGLEAGADYYLTKGSFHDESLLQAVVDLIGEPQA